MIKVENLKKTYDRGTKRANEVLHGLSFELPDTGFVCILGSSGCGKTSLLNAIGGLDLFDSGKIITENTEIKSATSGEMERERNANFGYIFQNYYLLMEHSVAYNVYLGMHALNIPHKEKMQRVKDALDRVDMLRYRKRPVNELSGGQQQRVAIARAIARRPRVIFADEPTGNLDEANTMNICTILKELSKESLIVMVTHETRIANFFADRIITLDSGMIVSDTTDWERGTMDAGEKDTVYAGDYSEEQIESANLSVRMLTSEDAAPVALTVVAEKDRIIVKFNDARVVLSSDMSASPYLKEGEHPILSHDSFKEEITEKKRVVAEKASAGKRFLGFKFLFKEARSSVSEKKIRRFSLGVFIIILSLMLSITVADFITVSHIEPEDFIIDDSHTEVYTFTRGPMLPSYQWVLDAEIHAYMNYLRTSDIDMDFIPASDSIKFEYKDDTISQIGTSAMTFPVYSTVNISRLDETTLIAGRMPENYNEIVVDRWVLDKALEVDGILQNMIPNAEYFLGKTLETGRYYSPVIVGICDSGEPSIYMSKEGLLSIATVGYELISLSEFKELTGYDSSFTLEINECIAYMPSTGISYPAGTKLRVRTGEDLNVKFTIETEFDVGFDMKPRIIVSDEMVDVLYDAAVYGIDHFTLWTNDKPALNTFLDGDMPDALYGRLDVSRVDRYTNSYNDYLAQTAAKIDGRTIVISSIIILSLAMLYLMQRSKIKDRMDLIAVYRLLGIPKQNLMAIFAIESFVTTVKYGLPAVAVTYATINILSKVEVIGEVLLFPLWGALLTFAAIALFRLIFAVIPVISINRKPPARLAADYDF